MFLLGRSFRQSADGRKCCTSGPNEDLPLDLSCKKEHHFRTDPNVKISDPDRPAKRSRERTLLPCQVCGKAFDRPSLLKRHIRTHTGEKPHVCDVCGKGFSTSSSLNTHRRIHSGEKPHECPICGKRFTASSNLYYHRMTHIKEKPHKCTTCHKSFPTPGDLKSHMYVHNGSWPFHCHVCNRGFSKQTNLRNHLFLHTGKKPHSCTHCGKCFALACNLRAHLRTHNEQTGQQMAPQSQEHDKRPIEKSHLAVIPETKEPHQRPDASSIPPPLMGQMVLWHSIQQQLASTFLAHQQQTPFRFLTPSTHRFKFQK